MHEANGYTIGTWPADGTWLAINIDVCTAHHKSCITLSFACLRLYVGVLLHVMQFA